MTNVKRLTAAEYEKHKKKQQAELVKQFQKYFKLEQREFTDSDYVRLLHLAINGYKQNHGFIVHENLRKEVLEYFLEIDSKYIKGSMKFFIRKALDNDNL